MITTWQGGAARGLLGAGQEGVTVQGGLGIPSSQGFTTIHPVIESMETGEVSSSVNVFSLKPPTPPSECLGGISLLVDLDQYDIRGILIFKNF